MMPYTKKKTKKGTQMWCYSEYHNLLKAEAASKGMSLIDYTKYKAEQMKKKKNQGGFKFEF